MLLAVAIWAANYCRFIVGPLQETIAADLSLTDNQMAVVAGTAFAIPMALGSIAGGYWVDRHRRPPLFIVFVALTFASTLLFAAGSSVAVLVAARSLAGFALGAVVVAAYATAADLYSPAMRGRATMVVGLGEVAAAPAAFAIGGALLQAEQFAWRPALVAMSLPLLAVAVSMLAMRDPGREAGTGERRSTVFDWFALWDYRSFLIPLMIARIMVWTADGGVLVWGAPTFSRQFDLPPKEVGAIIAAAVLVSGILGPILGGSLTDFCQRGGGARRSIRAMGALALVSALAALFPLLNSQTAAVAALTLFLTLGFMIGTAAIAISTIVIPNGLRGSFIGFSTVVAAVSAIGIAPLLVSNLSTFLGGPTMIGSALAIVCFGTSVIGALAFALGSPNFPDGTKLAACPDSLDGRSLRL
jgi:MFS family permease